MLCRYTLKQFHTHTPSEHKVAGRHFDMEMHFVHTAEVDGVTKLAVVACFYEKGDRSPTFIKQLMRQAVPGVTADPKELAADLDFRVCRPTSSPPSLFVRLRCFCLCRLHVCCVPCVVCRVLSDTW